MFLIPVILLFIRLDHGDHNEMIVNAIDGVTVVREYSHTFAYSLIFFVMYEMIAPMFVKTAHLSITSVLGVFLPESNNPSIKLCDQKCLHGALVLFGQFYAKYLFTILLCSQ